MLLKREVQIIRFVIPDNSAMHVMIAITNIVDNTYFADFTNIKKIVLTIIGISPKYLMNLDKAQKNTFFQHKRFDGLVTSRFFGFLRRYQS
uniref:Uncharacterized protein n=1 Tax=uncultured Desulfobacterium sp. TaxID=201089 RepID=E1YEH3_9BACT|nr:unknown protein [uncultured Desulfobacterium sp.]